ncbi:MAG TPA: flagellar export chaperone FliS [Terriglobales bacterium]|nr:flagellar export chaperone FliS [Terriglobales bacterium]
MDARLSYREAEARGATPVRLVVLLYEQALDDLRHAIAALEKGEIEARTRRINHAIVVIGQLQASLDLEQGGLVARHLERFYHLVRKGLMAAQFEQSARALQEQVSYLLLVHEAWLEVERVTAKAGQVSAERSSAATAAPGDNLADWSA